MARKIGPDALGDTLAMGRALLDLYEITVDHAWLAQAEGAAEFIDTHFAFHANGVAIGFATATNVADATHFAPHPTSMKRLPRAFRQSSFPLRRKSSRRPHRANRAEIRRRAAVAKSRLSSVGGLLLAEQESPTIRSTSPLSASAMTPPRKSFSPPRSRTP